MSRYKTPLRYPGGKQKLAPFILEVLAANDLVGGDYAEPYAGGAGVAMELLLAGKVRRVHLNDSSVPIYAFWHSVLHDTEAFCRLIRKASLTVEEWQRQRGILKQATKVDKLELGFSLFYLNRCNRSGIPSAGLIGGLAQTGKWKMDARFPRNELITRIESIASKKSSISLRNWDAEKFIKEYVPKLPRRSLVYCDPPYFNKAARLYLDHYKPKDHERIAKVIQKHLKRPWVVSYDGVPEILEFYDERRYFLYDLQYNAGDVYKGKEVFVFSDKTEFPKFSVIPSIDGALRELEAS